MKIALIIVGGIVLLIVFGAIVSLFKAVPAINHAVEMAEKHPPAEIPMPPHDTIPGMEKYDYFCSDGGPFILLPSVIKERWKGATLINLALKKGDYWKACQVVHDEGSHGIISAYKHPIFVVDAPMLAMHKEFEEDTFFIYALTSWQVDNLDSMIDCAINDTEEDEFVPTKESVQCNDGFVFMYAGDIYGDCMYGFKDMPMKAGVYNISEAHHKHDGNEVRMLKFSL